MNNDVTPPSPTNGPGATPPSEQPEESQNVASQPEPTVSEPEQPVAPAVVTSENTTPADFGKKPSWLRKIAFVVVILALLGGAVWTATQLNTPAKPAVTPVTKKDVAVVRVGIQEPIYTTLYPNFGDNLIEADIESQIFDGLTAFANKTRIVPSLATSWSNPDNNTWVFKLRSGVKFHDGNTMTAQSVKAALDATQGNDVLAEFNSTIKSVDVVDPSTIKITTNGPDPLLLNKLTHLWVYDTKDTSVNNGSSGTGPYTVKAGAQLTADNVQLTAFNGYWGDKPKVQEVDYSHYNDDQSVLTALQQNKLDMGIFNDQSFVPKAGAGFHPYTTDGLSVSFLVPNTLKAGSPLANKTVRQAIYTALDPAALMKSRGVTGKPATQPVPETVPGFSPSIKRPTTDVAKAKALLTQAGYPNGFTLKFTYYINAKNIALELQKELAAIGVTASLDEQTSGKQIQTIAYGGLTDLYFISENSDLIDTSDVYSSLVLQQKNYSNPTLTNLYNQASTTIDQAKRLKLLQQMNDTFMADYGVFPLYEGNGHTWAVRTNLHLEQQNFAGYTGLSFNEVYGQ